MQGGETHLSNERDYIRCVDHMKIRYSQGKKGWMPVL